MPTSATILAEALAAAGCEKAFGIPGGEVLSVMRALDAAGVSFTLTKHENAAGFMAEGVYQATGRPAILVATIGPGLANAVNVIANAEQDRVPLVVITGCVDAADSASYTHQVFDHCAVLAPITKASISLVPGAVATQVEKAVRLATEGRPGPVHIDLPVDLADSEEPSARPVRPPRVLPTAAVAGSALDELAAAFRAARKPLALLGMEILHQDASAAVAGFLKRHAIPAVATYKAKGVLDEHDPLSLGGAGLSPLADQTLLPLLGEADLLLLIGYDPIEMRHGWKHPWDPASQRVIEFTTDPLLHGMHQASDLLAGDIAAGLAALEAGGGPRETWPERNPARARAELAGAFPRDEAWGPAAIVDTVEALLPADAIATVDSGAHRILLSQLWRCRQPRGLLQSSGLCTMGCALPLAMGAKLAAPERTVVAFTGDAGLEMTLGELTTLRDLKQALPVVVFVDSSLALIELKQRRGNQPNLGVDFGATDFPGLATALGGAGCWADDRDSLEAAVRRALASETFTLIAARIPPRSYDGRF